MGRHISMLGAKARINVHIVPLLDIYNHRYILEITVVAIPIYGHSRKQKLI